MFRFGRLRFRVREVGLGKNKQKIEYAEGRISGGKNFGAGLDLNKAESKLISNPDILCRICLEGETLENQFANVCSCTKTNP